VEFFLTGVFLGSGTVMLSTTSPPFSWAESVGGLAFCVGCVAAAQAVIQYAKGKQNTAATAKVEAKNVSKEHSSIKAAK
jgi:hypothetical protein